MVDWLVVNIVQSSLRRMDPRGRGEQHRMGSCRCSASACCAALLQFTLMLAWPLVSLVPASVDLCGTFTAQRVWVCCCRYASS